MNYEKIKKVVVLKGGLSDERAVSLVSGGACAKALRSIGLEVKEIDANKETISELKNIKPDAVFNALHGKWGEDGCVQGILEWLQIPYTHSGVFSSALAMDKMKTKSIYQSVGLPVARSVKMHSKSRHLRNDMKVPYVIKPVNGGSSVGISFVNGNEDLRFNDDTYDGEIMLEEFIPGRELTITVLNDVPLTVTEIITKSWYDYEAKYSENGSSHIVPANLPNDIFETCKKYALRAHHALGCRGISRTDLRWDDTKGLAGIKLLETNSQPGMTPTSLTPEQAVSCGISFEGLCQSLIEDASCNR